MGTTKKRHLLSVIQKVLITCVMLVVISPFYISIVYALKNKNDLTINRLAHNHPDRHFRGFRCTVHSFRLCPHPVHNSRDVFQIHSFRQDHQNTYSGSFPIPFSSIFRLCKNRRFIFFCYYRICTRSLFCVHLSKAAFSSDLRSGL